MNSRRRVVKKCLVMVNGLRHCLLVFSKHQMTIIADLECFGKSVSLGASGSTRVAGGCGLDNQPTISIYTAGRRLIGYGLNDLPNVSK